MQPSHIILANLSANVPSVISIKYAILDNLSQTTKITFFPTTNSNFVMISTVSLVSYSPLNFPLVPLLYSLSSDTNHIHPHTFLHLFITPSYQDSLLPT